MSRVYPIEELCTTLEVSRSGFYAWRARRANPGVRARENAELLAAIREIHAETGGTYGSPRMTVELRERQRPAGRHRVARLMRQAGVCGRQRRRFRPCTTDSRHDEPIAPNRLRDLPAPSGPDRIWVGDVTFIPTDEGWDHLAVVLDAHSRRAVGHHCSEQINTALTAQAFRMACTHRRPPPKLIFHSDRGVQYASQPYRAALEAAGALASMSRTGNPYDNALAESFFSSLKTELVYRRRFRTRAEARRAIFEWIECFYNRRRRHSALGYLSPVDFENQSN